MITPAQVTKAFEDWRAIFARFIVKAASANDEAEAWERFVYLRDLYIEDRDYLERQREKDRGRSRLHPPPGK